MVDSTARHTRLSPVSKICNGDTTPAPGWRWFGLLVILLFGSVAPAARVVAVYDGDTFLTADSQAVRLLGIDAPESYQPGGDIARDFLERLLAGRTVRLESDARDRDDFGRLLRYVYLGDTCVNLLLVQRGYAAVRVYGDSLMLHDTLQRLEETAARIGRGLWAFNVFPPPSMRLIEQRIAALADSTGDGLETVSYENASQYRNRLVRVVGRVVGTYRSDKVLLLNFHQDYRNHFKVAIFAADLGKFPPAPEDYYQQRLVRVTGVVKDYKGAPEIIVRDPEQIEVLE